MSNMKNFGGFLDNYIKKYGNTAEQDKYVTGLINAKGYEINTFIYVKKSTNYYCYKIGAIIDNDPEGDGLVRMCVNIPYAFEGKKIRTKPTFAKIPRFYTIKEILRTNAKKVKNNCSLENQK